LISSWATALPGSWLGKIHSHARWKLKITDGFVRYPPMKTFLLLIGLILILEGLPYAAAPEAMQNWLKRLSETAPGQLRTAGLGAMVIGFLLCYAVQYSG